MLSKEVPALIVGNDFKYISKTYLPKPVEDYLDMIGTNDALDTYDKNKYIIENKRVKFIDFYADWSINGRSSVRQLGQVAGTKENPFTYDDLSSYDIFSCLPSRLGYLCDNMLVRMNVRGVLSNSLNWHWDNTVFIPWDSDSFEFNVPIYGNAIFSNTKITSSTWFEAGKIINCEIIHIPEKDNISVRAGSVINSVLRCNRIWIDTAINVEMPSVSDVSTSWGNNLKIALSTLENYYECYMGILFDSEVKLCPRKGDDDNIDLLGRFWQNSSVIPDSDSISNTPDTYINVDRMINCQLSGNLYSIEESDLKSCSVISKRIVYAPDVPDGGLEQREFYLIHEGLIEDCDITFDITVIDSGEDCGVYDGGIPILYPHRIWRICIFYGFSVKYINCNCTINYKLPEFDPYNNSNCYVGTRIDKYISYDYHGPFIECESKWWRVYTEGAFTENAHITKIESGIDHECVEP